MRISDWSSDVCSSDLFARGCRAPIETSSGDTAIRPPMTRRPLGQIPPKNGPRYNEFIASPKVRVIDEEGENLGVMLTAEAIEAAAEVGLDLVRSEEHTSELPSLMRISYAVFCLKKKTYKQNMKD